MSDIVVSPYSEYTFDTLDTSGNTTDYLTVQNWRYHTFFVTNDVAITALACRIEASLDGTNFAPISASSTGTADTSGNFVYSDSDAKIITVVGKYNYLRFFLEYYTTAGTKATFTVVYSGG